jgi:hypothetical protein
MSTNINTCFISYRNPGDVQADKRVGMAHLDSIYMMNSAVTKKNKLLAKLPHLPSDFTWDELVRLLRSFKYEMDTKGKTSSLFAHFT